MNDFVQLTNSFYLLERCKKTKENKRYKDFGFKSELEKKAY